MLEADYRESMNIQVGGRHNRQGNINATTYTWILRAQGNEVEERIYRVNKLRERIQEAAQARVGQEAGGSSL